MHDIGRLALAAVRPTEYKYLLESYEGTPRELLDREREIFGMDHCEVGDRLVTEWKLPEEFRMIVAAHHATRRTDEGWDMTALIRLSCRMADAAGFAAFLSCKPEPFDKVLQDLPAAERKAFHTEVESLALEITNKIDAIESI